MVINFSKSREYFFLYEKIVLWERFQRSFGRLNFSQKNSAPSINIDVEFKLDEEEDEDAEWLITNEYTDHDDVKGFGIGAVVKLLQKFLFATIKLLQRATKGKFYSIIFLTGYLIYFVAAMVYK